jgi:DNA-directed RNA polymerase subunit RPC12/RpoP
MDAAWPLAAHGARGTPTVNKMVCDDCGTVYYSAAARIMVERGERCAKCGGKLVLANSPRPERARGGPQHAGGPPGGAAA